MVVFHHICHLIAELFIHGIHLIRQLLPFYCGCIKALLLPDLNSSPLVSDHLCALPLSMLGWIHYRFTQLVNEFLFLGVMQ